MKVIERYIFQRTFAIFLAALIWVLVIAWTTQVLNRIDLVTNGGQSAAAFFVIASLLLVPVLPIVIPFAIGIAISQTLATMNQDSELVVIGAAGSPRTSVIRPILLVAIMASITSFAIHNTLEPYARQQLRRSISNINANIVTSVAQEGVFYKISNDLFVQISERMTNGQLGGIFVADTRDKESRYIYHAQRGVTVERDGTSLLILQDGILQRQSGDGRVSNVNFDSYSLDLSQFNRSTSSGAPQLYPKDRYLSELLDPDINDRFFLANPQQFRAEIHMRFSEWLYSIVFALIGLAVAGEARSARESRLHPTVTVMTIGLAVRWASFYSGGAADTQPFFSFMLYAIPLTMIAICSWFIIKNNPMELPTSWTDHLFERFQKDRQKLTHASNWFARRLGILRRRA